jgi:hypothetical protein
MSHTDALADYHDLIAEWGGASTGPAAPESNDATGPMEERKVAAQPRDAITRLTQLRQAEDGSGSGNGKPNPVRTQSQKKLKLCRYFGTPGGECRVLH